MAEKLDVELCVFCRRVPADPRWRPFCSERCKLQDLARWAEGSYRVPAEPLPEPEPSDPSDPTKRESQNQRPGHRAHNRDD